MSARRPRASSSSSSSSSSSTKDKVPPPMSMVEAQASRAAEEMGGAAQPAHGAHHEETGEGGQNLSQPQPQGNSDDLAPTQDQVSMDDAMELRRVFDVDMGAVEDLLWHPTLLLGLSIIRGLTCKPS